MAIVYDGQINSSDVNLTSSSEPPSKKKFIREHIRITPILDASLIHSEIPLVEFHVITVSDKKQISPILMLLPELPEEFTFLKRVKNGRILVSLATESLSDDMMQKLQHLGVSYQHFEVSKVPRRKPATRKQFDWAKNFWPTSFHPDKETENLLNDSYFSVKERESIRKWMKRTLAIGCIVVQDDESISNGSRSKELLKHDVMSMVSNLANKNKCDDEYLATGCDVYLRDEPCAMCAMALVHSRASRVFFYSKSSNGVLLPDGWQLHLEPVLNHHYKVFQIQFQEDEDGKISKCSNFVPGEIYK